MKVMRGPVTCNSDLVSRSLLSKCLTLFHFYLLFEKWINLISPRRRQKEGEGETGEEGVTAHQRTEVHERREDHI